MGRKVTATDAPAAPAGAGGVAIRCPPPPAGARPAGGHGATLAGIAGFARRLEAAGIERAFGLELRAAYRLDLQNIAAKRRSKAPQRRFFLRPAIEPLLYSYKDELDPAAAAAPVVDDFMACLRGAAAPRRAGDSRSEPDAAGAFVRYPEPVYALQWQARIGAGLPRFGDPLERSGYVFAETVLSHPYGDGNGRLSRALAIVQLGRDLGTELPLIPLGPILSQAVNSYLGALGALGATADWDAWFTHYEGFLRDALALGEELLG